MEKQQIEQQIARISEMEGYLDESAEAIYGLIDALEKYEQIRDNYKKLEEYYGSPAWRADFEADEAGLIPQDIKRGVLSEDELYDLITEHTALLDIMRNIFSAEGAES